VDILSKVRARYILVLAFLFLAFMGISSLAKSSAPSIDDVLRKPGASFDFGSLIFGFFALSLGTLSIAKAFEIMKKSTDKKEELKDSFSEAEIENLKCKINELSSSMQYKNEENQKLRQQMVSLEESFKEKLNTEELMKKSIASLRKECEKLISEKEKINLELSRKSWDDLFQNKNDAVEQPEPANFVKMEALEDELPVKTKSVPLKKKTSATKGKKITKAKTSFKKRSK